MLNLPICLPVSRDGENGEKSPERNHGDRGKTEGPQEKVRFHSRRIGAITFLSYRIESKDTKVSFYGQDAIDPFTSKYSLDIDRLESGKQIGDFFVKIKASLTNEMANRHQEFRISGQ